VLGRDYIRSLRARGLSETSIIYKHALRNAMGNVVTLLGLYIVGLLLGTTLVESVFAMQGIGTIAVNATTQHDLPVLEGASLYFTFVVIVAFLAVDLVRAWLNPKLRTR
jgi:peptide/nickel transport system permease protein